jgi:hypothetical protein
LTASAPRAVWRPLFPSKFLKATDIAKRPLKLTIDEVVQEDLNGEMKAIVSFLDNGERWALNRTNYDVLAETLGEETDDWGGAQITLRAEKVLFQGKPMPAIRVAGCKWLPEEAEHGREDDPEME